MKGERPIRVLIAEDEADLGEVLRSYLAERGHAVTVVPDGRDALDALASQPFDVALPDIVMPGLDGLEVLRQVRERPSPPECIIVTGNGTIDTAIAAMKLGAYDYASKPYRMAEIEILVRRAWEKRKLASDNRRLSARLSRVDAPRDFASVYAPMQAVLALARHAAPGEAAVLITGEPGTGKSELARYVHGHSSRAAGPLVYGDCAAMPAGDAEAALFGTEGPLDGVPSDVAASAIGLVESAAGGTLVLEDVQSLDSCAQDGLVELLSEGTFRRVGSRHRIESEVRVVATAGPGLSKCVRAGSFRADLLDALAKVSLELPPLRVRSVDIALFAHAMVREFGGPRGPALASEALDALQEYPWPGNLRELRNVVERAVLLADGGIIHAHELLLPAAVRAGTDPEGEALSLREVERRHIAAVLQQVNWHQGKAAAVLRISAKTLYRKIREYGFERPVGAGAP
ncbi:MAG: sigma-54-dependent transcriptional regulator [Gemmatimonadales bacterium]